ncbi:hypothetical protein A9P82_05960 [Arachidicoccus ginsenosidimutans]|nr:hypothetical protein A9P82_05960 [Arachidicoccus sp. BS20]
MFLNYQNKPAIIIPLICRRVRFILFVISLLFFLPDKKEPKNQDRIEFAKNHFISRHYNEISPHEMTRNMSIFHALPH